MLNLCEFGVDGTVGDTQLTYTVLVDIDMIAFSDGTLWEVKYGGAWRFLNYIIIAIEEKEDGLLYYQYDTDYDYDPIEDYIYDPTHPDYRGEQRPEGPSNWLPLINLTPALVKLQRLLKPILRKPKMQRLGLAALTHPRVNPGSNACLLCDDVKRLIAKTLAKPRRTTGSTKDLALNRNGRLFVVFALAAHPRLRGDAAMERLMTEDIMQVIASQM